MIALALVVQFASAQTCSALCESSYRTSAALSLYVAPGGNDSNDCASVDTACLTVAGVATRIPKLIRHPVTVTFANGNYTGGFLRDYQFDPASTAGAYIALVGSLTVFSPATGSATGTASAATACAINPFGNATLTDSTESWTTNDLRGYLLETTGGTGAGQFVTIASNTATTITLAGCWTVTPNATTTYTIHSWGANITTGVQQPGDYLSSAGGSVALGFENVQKGSSRNSDGFVFIDSIRTNAVAVGLWVANAHVYTRRARFDSNGSIAVEMLGPSPRLNFQASVATSTTSYALFQVSVEQSASPSPSTGGTTRLLGSYFQSGTSTVSGIYMGMPGMSVTQSTLTMTGAAQQAVFASGLPVANNWQILNINCLPGSTTIGVRADNCCNGNPITPSNVISIMYDSGQISDCATAIQASGPNTVITTDDSKFITDGGSIAVAVSHGAHLQLDLNTVSSGFSNELVLDSNGFTFSDVATYGSVLSLTTGAGVASIP